MSQTVSTEAPDPSAALRARKRKRLFAILAAVILVVGVLWLAYWLLVGSRRVSTEDAYVGADVAQVTALVGGPIIRSAVGETQHVAKGQVVAVIDPTDYQFAVDRARAELAQAERRVRQYFANDEALAAQSQARRSDIAGAQAQLASARADLARADLEYGRRRNLADSGAVSAEEMTQAQTRRQTAQAAVASAQSMLAQAQANAIQARGQRKAASALIDGGGVGTNPEVAVARARLAQAELDLQRTVVRSPVAGIVAKHAVDIGQRVQPGAQLMSVVPVQTAFVDANFKEGQLRKIHIGSSVTLTSDLYGDRVKFHGKVTGVAGGSGSAFALIPAQNATGNWIKVVQRVPVRIALDARELKAHPLRVGLSMKAVVQTP